MYFRSQKKSSQDVSLSDYIDTGTDGASLSFLDVVSQDDTMLEDLGNRQSAAVLGDAMKKCLTAQEKEVLSLRYGLGGNPPMRQREVADRLGISRSYVSRIEKRALELLRKTLET